MNPSEKSAQWISNAMKKAGISQAELARRVGLAPTRVCQILKGRRPIRVTTLFLLIEACGFEVIELRVNSPKKAA